MGKGWHIPDPKDVVSAEDIEVAFVYMAQEILKTNVETFIESHLVGMQPAELLNGFMKILVATERVTPGQARQLAHHEISSKDLVIPMNFAELMTLFTGGTWIGYAHAKIDESDTQHNQ